MFDQFFSSDESAKALVEVVKNHLPLFEYCTIIEPSAGDGQILKYLPKHTIAFDIAPKAPEIIRADFLKVPVSHLSNIVYVGNPPFGKCANKAVEFFNRCAEDGQVIAMILPKTFEKIFFQNRLNPYWHLKETKYLDKWVFHKNGGEVEVPCVIQLWRKRHYKRPLIEVDNTYFEVVNQEEADYSIRRVGGRAGMVLDGTNYSPSSTMFIRDLQLGVKNDIIHIYPFLREEASKTVGVRSITSKEITYYLRMYYNEKSMGRISPHMAH